MTLCVHMYPAIKKISLWREDYAWGPVSSVIRLPPSEHDGHGDWGGLVVLVTCLLFTEVPGCQSKYVCTANTGIPLIKVIPSVLMQQVNEQQQNGNNNHELWLQSSCRKWLKTWITLLCATKSISWLCTQISSKVKFNKLTFPCAKF